VRWKPKGYSVENPLGHPYSRRLPSLYRDPTVTWTRSLSSNLPEIPSGPPFRLLTLGRIDLRDRAGVEVRSVLAQPKRLALLIYLALLPEPQMVRRDALLPVFWPELDQERARGALRKAIHYLRRSLGDGVLIGRGDEEIGLAAGTVETDVAWFYAALATDDISGALRHYAGPFLPGFHVTEVPEFSHWMDSLRERLRGEAAEGAWRAVDARMADRDPEGARDLALRAHELAPLSETSVRRLLQVQMATGDRAEATRTLEAFERNLYDTLGFGPGDETRAILNEDRTLLKGSGINPPATPRLSPSKPLLPPETPRLPPSEPLLAPRDASSPPPPASRSGPTRTGRRASWFALLGVLFVAIGLGAAFRGVPAQDEPLRLDPERIAFLPFEIRGSEELTYLSEGLAVLLAAGIDGAGGYHAVDPVTLFADLGGARDPGTAVQALGAGLYTMGRVTGSSDGLHIEAHVRGSVPGSSGVLARGEVSGSEAELVPMVHALVQSLLAELLGESGEPLSRSAAQSTTSLPALKAYLRGDTWFREARFDLAVEAFQEAVEHDSAFALAHYRLSSAANWAGRMELVSPHLTLARANRDRLTGRALLLVDAAALGSGAASEALRAYRTILERYPNDPDAALELAELLFHRGPPSGRPLRESKLAFERVLGHRPMDLNSRIHLVRIAALEGDRDEVQRLADELLAAAPGGDHGPEIWVLRAMVLDEAEALDRALAGRDRWGDQRILDALWRSAAFSGRLDVAADAARALVRASDPPEWSGAAWVLAAHAEAGRGRRLRALEMLDPLRRYFPGLSAEAAALFLTLPGVPSPPAAFLEAVEQWIDQAPEVAAASGSGVYRGNPLGDLAIPGLDQYHRGLVFVEQGRLEEAKVQAGLLEAGNANLTLHAASAELRARIALREGSPASALVPLEAVMARFGDELNSAIPSLPRGGVRFLYGEVLRELGRLEEALPVYESVPEDLAFDLIYVALAHLRTAQVLASLGRTDEASMAAARALRIWEGADPEFEGLISEARRLIR